MGKMTRKKVCVFCGASEAVNNNYKDIAIRIGQHMAQNNIELVYGGSNSGLMASISNSVIENGGIVTGVYPKILNEKEKMSHYVTNQILVETMSIRKDVMISNSDAFLILPGGIGTLDELFEVLTLKSLGYFDKPIIVFNYNGFWNLMQAMCQHMIQEGFVVKNIFEKMTICDTLEEIFALINR